MANLRICSNQQIALCSYAKNAALAPNEFLATFLMSWDEWKGRLIAESEPKNGKNSDRIC